jgi:hypothetical protein
MRILVVLSLFLRLNAQIVADNNGALHFFSTLVPTGSGLAAAQRLYRYSPAGIEIESSLQVDPLVDLLGTIDASADGKAVSFWMLHHPLGPNPFCLGQPCYYPLTFSSKLMLGDVVKTFDRAISLSRDGRYAVLFDNSKTPERLDLSTGEKVSAPIGLLAAPRQAITADGRVLLAVRGTDDFLRLLLWSPSGQSEIGTILLRGSLGTFLPAAIISANGVTVVWADFNDNSLHTIDTASGSDRLISTAPGPIFQPSISDDGNLATYLSADKPDGPPRLHLVRTDGSEERIFDGAPEGISQATIQGSGENIFAFAAGRILRIDTTDLTATDLWKPAPVGFVLDMPVLQVAPGSY